MKFKHAESTGWYYQIDDDGNKGQSWSAKNRPKMYEEMMKWVAEGNEIEPRYTAEELAEKEAADAQQALESQKAECIRLLNQTEIHCTSDPPYPDDVVEWVAYRKVLREILQSDELCDMPKKPF